MEPWSIFLGAQPTFCSVSIYKNTNPREYTSTLLRLYENFVGAVGSSLILSKADYNSGAIYPSVPWIVFSVKVI